MRKCLEGLDYFVAEDGKAFEVLGNYLDKMDLTDERRASLHKDLLDAKRYIKSDFKVGMIIIL